MSKLLISVTSAEEALLALEGGADIIDLKNPLQGALGALPVQVVREAVAMVDGRRITSATTGDLPMQPQLLEDAVLAMADTGVDIIKIGLFGDTEANRRCIQALQRLITERQLAVVAVMMADLTPDFSLLPDLQQAGFWGVMLDTAHKDGRNLLDHCSLTQLEEFIQLAGDLNTGLAGSLKSQHLLQLIKMKPSYLGVRGAVCVGFDRVAQLSKTQVSALKDMLHEYNTSAESADLV